MSISITDLPKPPERKRLSTFEILQGAKMTPEAKLGSMDAGVFEQITLHWAHEYLGSKYVKVRRLAGPGDKGRDIVGYKSAKAIDIYQCKHYASKISSNDILVEFGKLCYYTFEKAYPIPDRYVIVSCKGAATSLLDLIADPKKINELLIKDWDKKCKTRITQTKKILLEGKFKEHVEKFDFSIVEDLAPHEFLEQFKETSQYSIYFGGGLKRFREVIPYAEEEVQPRELSYVSQLFEVYSEKTGNKIIEKGDIKKAGDKYLEHFNQQRNSFYSAESLEKFSRDNFLDVTPAPFDELKEEGFNIVSNSLLLNSGKTGFDRLLHATMEIKRQSFPSNPLSNELKSQDKEGICHYLANEEKVKWID